MKNCYSEIKELLKAEKKVFFTGTACQVAGLKGYLGKEYDNLLCAAIICHGVPSPKVWRKYKNALEKRFGGKMTNVNMRESLDILSQLVNMNLTTVRLFNGKHI